MGSLFYGSPAIEIRLGDRLLAHLQMVCSAKLRRQEGFLFTWTDPDGAEGPSSIWVSPTIPLRFRFATRAGDGINRDWLEEMLLAASSAHGLDTGAIPDPGADDGSEAPVRGLAPAVELRVRP